MPAIKINGKDHSYEEDQVVEFAEGLIGLPRLRRAALIESDEYAPFCWLASLDDEDIRFVVIDPTEIFSDYRTETDNNSAEEKRSLWAIVKISSDWQKTTVNLRAPIFIDEKTKCGAQVILTGSDYKLEETLPLN